MRVLFVTSEWPTAEQPFLVPFIVRQAEYLRKASIDVDVFQFRGGMRLANYAKAWVRLQKILNHEKYDLIHAHFGQSALLTVPKRCPLVLTFRGSDLEGISDEFGAQTNSGRLLKLTSKIGALAADQIILVSESLAKHIRRRDYHVIPSGLDLDSFQPQPRSVARKVLGISDDIKIVLFAADPENAKKRYRLAKAAVDLLGSSLKVQLLVIQGIRHDLMPLYMNASDALILTSVHEGSPNVVKEALACNLPVVATDVGDVRARIQQVEGCAIVEPIPKEIALALTRVLRRNRRIDGRNGVCSLNETLLTNHLIKVYKLALKH